MKKKTMIGTAVFLLILSLALAAAEEVSDFTGKWVAVAVQSLDCPELNLPVPAQWNAEMPALDLNGDGTARWTQGEEQRDGTWTCETENGEIHLAFAEGEEPSLTLKTEEGRLQCETRIGEIGQVQIRFGREEPSEIAGKWIPVMQTYGDGEYWAAYSGTGTPEFRKEGTGRYTEYGGTKNESRTDFTWRREGNDVVLSVRAAFEGGTEGEYPFEFYQLDQGLLKRFVSRGEGENVLLVYGREGEEPVLSNIAKVDPLLNTAWELTAIEVRGVRVPLSVPGIETEEYLAFSSKGNGRLIHLEGNDLKQVDFTCRVQKGTLHLIVSGHDPIPCRWADGETIVRETAGGQKLYYQRKWMPEAPGGAEDQ